MAYPEKISNREYILLICTLREEGMSHRAVAYTLSLIFGGNDVDYIVDVENKASSAKITLSELDGVRAKLMAYMVMKSGARKSNLQVG